MAWANNYYETKNQTLIDRISSLDSFTMFMWEEDTVIIPRESAHFAVYDRMYQLVALEDQALYKEDWLGLQKLKNSNRLA